jgi:hypothetical protein
MNPRSNLERSSYDGWLRLNHANRYVHLNLGHWSQHGWSSAFLLRFNAPVKQSPGAAPWPVAQRAQTRSVLHQSLKCFCLRDLGDKRNPFHPLTAADMVGVELAMMRQIKRPFLVTGVTSSGAPAQGMAPVVVVAIVLLPPSDSSAWDAPVRWDDYAGTSAW